MKDLDLSQYIFEGLEGHKIADLKKINEEDKERLLMSGVDVSEAGRSGTFMHMDHAGIYCKTRHEGIEILDTKDALKKYDGLQNYFWKLADKEKDEFTRKAYERLQGGYFIRAKKGAKIEEPVQSCLFMKAEKIGQSVHNIIIVEEDADVHIITGCAVSSHAQEGMHIGISEFFVKRGGRLTFTMIHNWGENVVVRPRSVGVVEEGGVFLNNYLLLKPVKDLQMYPVINLNGNGAVARFNSILVGSKRSYIDVGNRVILNAPETRAEIISRAIAKDGTIVARGHIQGNVSPARGHLECKGLILGGGKIRAIPELDGTVEGVELSHEAAVGKIAQEEIEYLMLRGLDENEATSTIVHGFLNVDIMGLPKRLKKIIDKTIEESEKDMF